MGKLQEDFACPIRTGPRGACEGLINLLVTDFTAASGEAPAAPATGSLPAGKVASAPAKPL